MRANEQTDERVAQYVFLAVLDLSGEGRLERARNGQMR